MTLVSSWGRIKYTEHKIIDGDFSNRNIQKIFSEFNGKKFFQEETDAVTEMYVRTVRESFYMGDFTIL